jgi:hypothetical protein
MIKATRAAPTTLVDLVVTRTKVAADIEHETHTTTIISIKTNTPRNNMVVMVVNPTEWVTMDMAQVEWEILIVCNIKEAWEVLSSKMMITKRDERVFAVATIRSNRDHNNWVVNNPLGYNSMEGSIPRPPAVVEVGQTKVAAGAEVAKADGKGTNFVGRSALSIDSDASFRSYIGNHQRSSYSPLINYMLANLFKHGSSI